MPYFEYQLLLEDWKEMEKQKEEQAQKQQEQERREYENQMQEFKSTMPQGIDSGGNIINYND